MGARHATAIVAAVVVALPACGGVGGDAAGLAPSPPPATEPAVTAPPALTPEEQAAADIEATFVELIAAWDDFKANARDYGGVPGWNVELVGGWNVEGAADADLANWIAAWRSSEIEQVGQTSVASHEVSALDLDVAGQGVHEAASVACLDMSALSYVDYEGSAADLTAPPSRYQHWQLSWTYATTADPGSGTDAPGWYVSRIDVSLDEPCR